MEEKQEKKQEPEFKGNMGIVWLVGLLTILLGCTFAYTAKLTRENMELRQMCKEQQIYKNDQYKKYKQLKKSREKIETKEENKKTYDKK